MGISADRPFMENSTIWLGDLRSSPAPPSPGKRLHNLRRPSGPGLLGERRRLQQQAGGRSKPRVNVEAADAEIARLEKELGVDNTGRGSDTGDG